MKAIVYTKYGGPEVLQLKEVEKPVPRDNEVLVKVYATTVNRTDCATIASKPFFMRLITGPFGPKKQIPGTEFAGEIEAVGKSIVSYKVGDRVFGFDDMGLRAYAQFLTISEDKMAKMPENVAYEQAAASSEGAHYAYNFMKKVDIRSGNKILVNGSTGAIGSAAVQLLTAFGVDVTAVCNTKNMELVKSLGASKVIDYTKEDFTKSEDQKFNFVFDTVGKSSFFKCKKLLKPGGIYISSDLGYMAQNIFLPFITPIIKPIFGNRKTASPFPTDIAGSLRLVKKLTEEGKLRPVIDSKYPLEQVAEAYGYVRKGHKTGNVVIAVDHNSKGQ